MTNLILFMPLVGRPDGGILPVLLKDTNMAEKSINAPVWSLTNGELSFLSGRTINLVLHAVGRETGRRRLEL